MPELRDAAGTERTTASWRWSESLTSTRKLSKADSRAFHEMDILPQVTFEIVRWLRRGSATKARRKKKKGKHINLKHHYRFKIKTHKTKSIKF